MKDTRIINGKRYELFVRNVSKRAATNIANRSRKKNYLIRVIKGNDGYTVWGKRK